MVPLKNSVEEGPQEVEVIGWRLDPERSMGPVGYFGIYPKSNSKSLKGFKQRGMCSEPHCFFFKKKNHPGSCRKVDWERPQRPRQGTVSRTAQ